MSLAYGNAFLFDIYNASQYGSLTCNIGNISSSEPPSGSSIIWNNTSSNPTITINRGNGSGGVAQSWQIYIESTAGADYRRLIIRDNTAGRDVFKGDASAGGGGIRFPSNPAFFVYRTGSDISIAAPTAYDFNAIPVNIGSDFNNTTNLFTAPISGYYFFSVSYFPDNDIPNGTMSSGIYINGVWSNYRDFMNYTGTSGYRLQQGHQILVNLAANDNVRVTSASATFRPHGNYGCYFCGWLCG